MKKPLVDEWIRSAKADLMVIERIIDLPDLTHMVAFHSQQCIEKCLKALAENHSVSVPKTHNLDRLVKIISEVSPFDVSIDLYVLDLLDELYIESRYPSEFGLLPCGLPTVEESCQMSDVAQDLHNRVLEFIDE